MADITTKMSVTGLSTYKKSMNEAKEAVKTLDEELKLNEEQYKANGNAELYMANKLALLKKRIEEQKKVVSNAEKALKEMRDNGVEPSSKSFQNMQQNVYRAATKLTSMKTELKNVESGAEGAKKETSEMNKELQGIGKNVAWQTVSEGLKNITSQLESGARAAVNFGKKIIQSAKGSTGYADEIKTIVAQYEDMGLTTDSYQRMKNVEEFIDTPVDAILTARQRMQKAAASNKGKQTLEETLGIGLSGQNAEDLFWEVGDALLNMGDAFDKESAAQTMFGRSWRELMPLFKTGREEYEKALSEQSVLTEEQVEKLAKADDAIKSVEQQVELLKRQFWADNADKITDLLEWVVDNKDGIVDALTAIGAGFGALKIGEFAANVGQAVNGLKELRKLGDGGTPTIPDVSSDAAAGGAAAVGGGFWTKMSGMVSTAIKVAPWLAGAAVVLTPGKSQDDSSFTADGRLTNEGYYGFIESASSNKEYKKFLMELGGIYGADQLRGILRNGDAVSEIFSSLISGGIGGSTLDFANEKLSKYTGGTTFSKDWLGVEFNEEELNAILQEIQPSITPMIVMPDDSAEEISKQIGIVPVSAELVFSKDPRTRGWGGFSPDGSNANGLWSVPFDGYHAVLHKGERIVPEREVNSSRNYSSNMYIESMYMNNGQDADALAAKIAAENRRTMSGHGSR